MRPCSPETVNRQWPVPSLGAIWRFALAGPRLTRRSMAEPGPGRRPGPLTGQDLVQFRRVRRAVTRLALARSYLFTAYWSIKSCRDMYGVSVTDSIELPSASRLVVWVPAWPLF